MGMPIYRPCTANSPAGIKMGAASRPTVPSATMAARSTSPLTRISAACGSRPRVRSRDADDRPLLPSRADHDAERLAEAYPVFVARFDDPSEHIHVELVVLVNRHVAKADHAVESCSERRVDDA
jgi:hypothetical protein